MRKDYYKLETRQFYAELRETAKAKKAIDTMKRELRKPQSIRFFVISGTITITGSIIWDCLI